MRMVNPPWTMKYVAVPMSFARTNAEGEWEMEAVAVQPVTRWRRGSRRWRVRKKQRGGRVGHGARAHEGISLVLPAPEDLWGEKQLQLMAAQLSGMIEPKLNDQEDRLAQSQEALQVQNT